MFRGKTGGGKDARGERGWLEKGGPGDEGLTSKTSLAPTGSDLRLEKRAKVVRAT